MDGIDLAQGKDMWRAVIKAVMRRIWDYNIKMDL
jgi:hypothetical protein